MSSGRFRSDFSFFRPHFPALGMLTLKESTRWLTMKDRYEEAWESLRWARASDSEEIRMEMSEIRAGVEYEMQAREGFKLSELLDKQNLDRTIIAAAVFTVQQATGATAFAYYGPQCFKLLVGSKGNTDSLLTAIFGVVKFCACLLFMAFVVEIVGRRKILAGRALLMAVCKIATAATLRSHPAPEKDNSNVTSSGVATFALIYLFGPLPWPYVAELFPTRTRDAGIALGVAFQWLFIFVFSLTTPYMIRGLRWGTFLLWGLFDIVIVLFSWYCLTETRGKTLEEISVPLDAHRNSDASKVSDSGPEPRPDAKWR
ncbi:Quinate permease [Pseudocercospora fuligena]|uniref:Quinate permease n=1 Tax=Pseudocercospora fuligena TaxID=685502 RepID=A0A8H6VIH1_9PEZI|nr:Quinate permease [Pseudocercospora fuligena]